MEDAATFGFFLWLAADLRNGILANGNPKDVAEDKGYPVKRMRAMLTQLEGIGWIEWVKPTNQHADGSIRILRDWSAVKRAPTRAPTHAPSEMGGGAQGKHGTPRTMNLEPRTRTINGDGHRHDDAPLSEQAIDRSGTGSSL